MFTAPDRPTGRPAEYHVFDDSPANEVLHGIDGRAQESGIPARGNNGRTRTAKRENKEGKGKEREREEDFAEECHSGITFMNCCVESQGERERELTS